MVAIAVIALLGISVAVSERVPTDVPAAAVGGGSAPIASAAADMWARLGGVGPVRELAGATTRIPAPSEVRDATAAPRPAVDADPVPAEADDAGPVVNPPPPGPNRAAPDSAPASSPTAESTAVYPENFPDPFVMHAHGFHWAFSTQSGLTSVPTLRSLDLVNWEWVGDALHRLPQWAEYGHTWAPSVLERGSTFVLYYTTRHRATGLQCISRAASVLPQGPYIDESDGPLVCQTERGGSIDPSPFVDGDGRAWLLWKSEGTLLGEPTRIWVQALTADGRDLVDAPVQLLERQLDWEFPIIEAPSMAVVDGRHHLFYSGSRWETADYAVGHAVCESVTGPCRRTSPNPVLATRPDGAGPGGQELVTAPDGEMVLVHHMWEPGVVGYTNAGARRLHITSLRFDDDRVHVGGPWAQEEPAALVADLGSRGTRAGTPGHAGWTRSDGPTASRWWTTRR